MLDPAALNFISPLGSPSRPITGSGVAHFSWFFRSSVSTYSRSSPAFATALVRSSSSISVTRALTSGLVRSRVARFAWFLSVFAV